MISSTPNFQSNSNQNNIKQNNKFTLFIQKAKNKIKNLSCNRQSETVQYSFDPVNNIKKTSLSEILLKQQQQKSKSSNQQKIYDSKQSIETSTSLKQSNNLLKQSNNLLEQSNNFEQLKTKSLPNVNFNYISPSIRYQQLIKQPEKAQIQELQQKLNNINLNKSNINQSTITINQSKISNNQSTIAINQSNISSNKAQQKQQKQQRFQYKRIVTPPSILNHDKFKNYLQNPDSMFINFDQQLDKVFRKSKQSIIRQAKPIKIKDWEINQNTDLLNGFKG